MSKKRERGGSAAQAVKPATNRSGRSWARVKINNRDLRSLTPGDTHSWRGVPHTTKCSWLFPFAAEDLALEDLAAARTMDYVLIDPRSGGIVVDSRLHEAHRQHCITSKCTMHNIPYRYEVPYRLAFAAIHGTRSTTTPQVASRFYCLF